MHPTARLAAFAATLALVGGGAAAVGGATGATPPFQSCLDASPAATAMGGDAMAGARPMAEPVPGSDGTRGELAGISLRPVEQPLQAGGAATWRFTVTDCEGNAIRDFEREQTKLLHLIVVRSDMTGYQHLHPTLQRDGTWSVEIDFAEPGRYRAIADFITGGRKYVLGTTLVVPGSARPAALPAPSTTAASDGYEVSLDRPAALTAGREAELTFKVTRDGSPVTDLEPYLGAYGHLVALHAGDLAYSHVHPVGEAVDRGAVTFDAELHKAGTYRLFLQFQTHGLVHTVALTQEVTR